jgi:hypothetical protein
LRRIADNVSLPASLKNPRIGRRLRHKCRNLQPRRSALMPRYYFNTRIGKELILDPEGEDLRDPDHAWEVARTTIRQLLKTEGSQPGVLNAILEVTDDEGEIVLEFPFAEAVFDPPDEVATRH